MASSFLWCHYIPSMVNKVAIEAEWAMGLASILENNLSMGMGEVNLAHQMLSVVLPSEQLHPLPGLYILY